MCCFEDDILKVDWYILSLEVLYSSYYKWTVFYESTHALSPNTFSVNNRSHAPNDLKIRLVWEKKKKSKFL